MLDYKNNTIENPNAFEVNTAIQRCLAKAIALHGLGLYVYAGEDLPNDDTQPTKAKPAKAPQKPLVKTTFSRCGSKIGNLIS